jgi:hypothetical protein
MRVSYGSLTDITARSRHVRFTLDSGHSPVRVHVRKVPRTDINTDAHEALVTRASVRNLTTRWTHKGPPLMDGGPLRLLSISYPGCFFE